MPVRHVYDVRVMPAEPQGEPTILIIRGICPSHSLKCLHLPCLACDRFLHLHLPFVALSPISRQFDGSFPGTPSASMFKMRFFTILALATEALAVSYPQQQVLIGGRSRYSVQTPPLDTDWTYEVGTDPWPQYPRPKLARSQWQSLNGIWTYSNASSLRALRDPPFNQTLSQEVLVPFCLESGLSGIQGANTFYSWYRTMFTVPPTWTGDRVLLNFGAVDYEATVFVNGQNATFHRGGYSAFSVDVTDYLNGRHNELYVISYIVRDRD
jgi:hypothetical protein